MSVSYEVFSEPFYEFHKITDQISKSQDYLYTWQRNFTVKNNLAFFTALPISLADVSLETVKYPIMAIESLAFGIISFLGAFVSSRFGFTYVYHNLMVDSVKFCCLSLRNILKAPFYLINQIFISIKDPASAGSIQRYVFSNSLENFENKITNSINDLNYKLKYRVRVNRIFDRLLLPPIVLAEFSLEHLSNIACIVESLTLSIINIIGLPFSKCCSLRGFVYSLNKAVDKTIIELENILRSPLNLAKAYLEHLNHYPIGKRDIVTIPPPPPLSKWEFCSRYIYNHTPDPISVTCLWICFVTGACLAMYILRDCQKIT